MATSSVSKVRGGGRPLRLRRNLTPFRGRHGAEVTWASVYRLQGKVAVGAEILAPGPVQANFVWGAKTPACLSVLARRIFKFWFVEVGCPEDVPHSAVLFLSFSNVYCAKHSMRYQDTGVNKID